MRAVQIALLVISIQIGMGIIAVSGLYEGNYYEKELVGVDMPNTTSALSESEQQQTSVNFLNRAWKALTWGWVIDFFQPWYSLNAGLKSFIDSLILLLNGISSFIIGVALLEFFRNRINVLGG